MVVNKHGLLELKDQETKEFYIKQCRIESENLLDEFEQMSNNHKGKSFTN